MSGSSTFPSGLVLEAHKQPTLGGPLVSAPPPTIAVLAMDQGSGRESEPVVAIGAGVAVGSLVGQPRDPYSAPVHSPVSGTVVAIEAREAGTSSGTSTCVVIESDHQDRRDPSQQPCPEFAALAPEELVARLRAAGVAGLGGAAFPTATKLDAARVRTARRLILNGAECEPWICSDDALMRASAPDVLLGAQVLMHALEAESCVIGIEDDKPEAVAAIQAAIEECRADNVRVQTLPAIYPQGAERQLITAVTGAEVPTGKLPADVGVTCQNVATAAAIARWIRTGEPCISRIVTVTGSGVTQPCNVVARIGTPLAALIDAAGGYTGEPLRLIAGGNMTGRALPSDEIGLTKATNCVLVATHADIAPRHDARELPCIRCGDCATVCPAALLPQQLHRAALADDEAWLLALGIRDCIDCGCCDYVCPSQIPLAHRFRTARQRLREREAKAQRAAAARERYERHERRLQEAAATAQRAFDDARRLARGDEPPAPPPAAGTS